MHLNRRRSRFLTLTLASLAASACATASPATSLPAPASGLATSIDSLIDAAPLHRAAWGILVQDAASGTVLYSRNAERLHIPASNMKLVVTTAALGRLGPEWQYTTELLAGGRRGDHAETVVVRGSGDPTWSLRFHDRVAAPFDSMAAAVARAGIRSIGTLLVDVSRFRDEPVHPTWEVSDLPGVFAPPVDAFAAADGTFRLALFGGPVPGTPGRAEVAAPLAQPIRATVTTDTVGARGSATTDFLARRDTIFIAARVGAGGSDTVSLAVTRPAESATAALLASLRSRGIAVEQVSIVRDSGAAAAARAGTARVGEVRSAPMSRIVAAILRPSQNWISEQVLKTLGAEFVGDGSWRGGNEVARRFLIDQVRVDSTAFQLRDASGMSAQNLLTPASTVAMLAYARSQPWALLYRDAMAQPGLAGSTLSGRLRSLDGRVFAKTGTITNVNSLSGYFIAADGREYLFSILTNASGAPAAVMRTAVDEVVLTMARHLDSR